jgi:alanyl-tRNA synthetase
MTGSERTLEWTGNRVRDAFLEFFEQRDHRRIHGVSLIPDNDPTLLYVNSGMAPLKAYFVGEQVPSSPRLCNVQPCLRTTDIEAVGDRHHLTFFEMLGSWSIGDYFKQEAIELAFELLTEVFGFPAELLYATVYAGDSDLGVPADEEAARAWESVGFGPGQIVPLGADNFWGPAGDFGPCGPCTEVFFDTGPEYGPEYRPGGLFDTEGRYIEIWNAGVFMQYDKTRDGDLVPLPFASVDTGSGLERMVMVLNDLDNAYETDLLANTFEVVRSQLGSSGRRGEAAARIVTDHVRAATFVLAEGVQPSNEGRGYIPRRLIRKSMGLVASAGVRGFDFAGVVDEVVERARATYPRLEEHRREIHERFERERRNFDSVLERGLERLGAMLDGGASLTGTQAFDLVSTYGLPLDVVVSVMEQRGGSVDVAAFEGEFERHRRLSRPRKEGSRAPAAAGLEDVPPTEFVGYDSPSADATVRALLVDGAPVARAEAGTEVVVVVDRTPFYTESGGQVGDTGELVTDGARATVVDTQRTPGGHHVHEARLAEGSLSIGDRVRLSIDETRRAETMANHSATHLLHAALRSVLGDHVKQEGSLVEPARLRFDFRHPTAVTPDELDDVERFVSEAVRRNIPRTVEVVPYDVAIERGAIALFGEKYGDVVRLVEFDGVSRELCGGTHVDRTGDIGVFRIVSQGSVGSGIRRISAVTGAAAVELGIAHERLLRDAAAELRVAPADLPARIATLLARAQDSPTREREAEVAHAEAARGTLPDGTPYVAAVADAPPAALRERAVELAEGAGGVALLAAEDGGRGRVVVAVARPLTNAYDAARILKAMLEPVGGRGGGKPHLAEGGVPDTAPLDDLGTWLQSAVVQQP